MVKQLRQRAKNLTDADIEVIVGILDGWSDKLTWDGLIDAITSRLRAKYTRQALNQHERIKQTFQLAKERLSGVERPRGKGLSGLNAVETQAFMERFKKLEGENARLRLENERLLEQFVVWAYNAHTRGLDREFLSRPLPRVDRDQTKLSAVTGSSRK
jgi:hypothetical protein